MMELRPLYPKELIYHVKNTWSSKEGRIMNVRNNKYNIGISTTQSVLSGHPCPYELFIGSIGACIINTFLSFTEKRELQIFKCDIETKIDLNLKRGRFNITNISSKGKILVPKEALGYAKKSLDLALTYCPLTRLLQEGTTFTSEIEVVPCDEI